VLLDAPNIAYHNQNYEGGRFRFEQIAAMVALLRSRGERVLVMLPQAYVQEEIPNHTCSSQQRDRCTAEGKALLRQWREQGILYVCPRGIYDDWFWMYASVHGATSRVVTNDAMRDHRMDLLPERAFRRWRETQIMGFGFLYPEEEEEAAEAAAAEAAAAEAEAAEAEAEAEEEGGEVASDKCGDGAEAAAKQEMRGDGPGGVTAAAPASRGGAAKKAAALATASRPPDAEEGGAAAAEAAACAASAPMSAPLASDELDALVAALGATPWVTPPPEYSTEAQRVGDTWFIPVISDERAEADRATPGRDGGGKVARGLEARAVQKRGGERQVLEEVLEEEAEEGGAGAEAAAATVEWLCVTIRPAPRVV